MHVTSGAIKKLFLFHLQMKFKNYKTKLANPTKFYLIPNGPGIIKSK